MAIEVIKIELQASVLASNPAILPSHICYKYQPLVS